MRKGWLFLRVGIFGGFSIKGNGFFLLLMLSKF